MEVVNCGGGGAVFSAFETEADITVPVCAGVDKVVSVGSIPGLFVMETGAEIEVAGCRSFADGNCVGDVAVDGAPEANAENEPGKEGEDKRTDGLFSGSGRADVGCEKCESSIEDARAEEARDEWEETRVERMCLDAEMGDVNEVADDEGE